MLSEVFICRLVTVINFDARWGFKSPTGVCGGLSPSLVSRALVAEFVSAVPTRASVDRVFLATHVAPPSESGENLCQGTDQHYFHLLLARNVNRVMLGHENPPG